MLDSMRELAGAPLHRLYQRRDSSVIHARHVKLPRRAGVRLVLATDIHARDDWFPERCVRDLVDAVNRIEGADAVLLGGDFVGDDASAIDWAAPALGDIDAPIFATLGNHDHWTDAERITSALERAGIEVMTNRSRELARGMHLAGIDSCWGGSPDAERALHAVPDDAPTVVLGHEPHLATMHERFLHLAGHTHQGQVRVPVVGEPVARRYYPPYSQPYPRKLYTRGAHRDSFVYTTAGVGYSTVSWRFNCPPEIVVIDV